MKEGFLTVVVSQGVLRQAVSFELLSPEGMSEQATS